MIEVITDQGLILSRLCAAAGRWGMVVSLPDWSAPLLGADDGAERMARMLPPELTLDDFFSIIASGGGFILGDEDDIDRLYSGTHGDDGACEGPPGEPCTAREFHVYALTCNDKGELQHENT
jgi:hypothetical protein